MDPELQNHIDDLEEVSNSLKLAFVDKDEIIEMMVVCAIAQEHLLIVGPPGTGKSELVKLFARLCNANGKNGNGGAGLGKDIYFEYLFTRFTEPNEIFGPVDIAGLKTGAAHQRITDGMLPQADIAFLDEVFKANSAILNALLTILNERIFYNGGLPRPVPLMFGIGATNEVPADPNLEAIYDRFLMRMWTQNVDEALFHDLVQTGWRLEMSKIRETNGVVRASLMNLAQLRELHSAIPVVNLDDIQRDYAEIIRRIRAEGIRLSDRRAIKLLKLIAAATLRRKTLQANRGDFWVLQHIWNTPEQIPHLHTIVAPYLDGFETIEHCTVRSLEKIEAALVQLRLDQTRLKTDVDFSDFLHQAHRLRQDLLQQGASEAVDRLCRDVETIVDTVMETMQNLED